MILLEVAAASGNPFEWFGELLSGALGWILGVVQSVHPALRTALAGFGILLETSILVGVVVAKKLIERSERRHLGE